MINSDSDDSSSQDEEPEEPRHPRLPRLPHKRARQESDDEVIDNVNIKDEQEEITIDLTGNDEVSWFNV